MGDLRLNPPRLSELTDHIVSREGIYLWLYADRHGWITTGIGELIDRPNGTLRQREAAARNWFQNHNIRFTHKRTHAVASEDAFIDDWLIAVRFHQTNGPTPARNYAAPTNLRITTASARLLLRNVINRFANRVYRHAPYLILFDERIVMALVDVRYNSAGVAIFDMHDDPHDNFHIDIPRFWNALRPNSPSYDLDEAMRLFESIWRNRGSSVYQERHRLRVVMFRSGIAASRATYKKIEDAAKAIRDVSARILN